MPGNVILNKYLHLFQVGRQDTGFAVGQRVVWPGHCWRQSSRGRCSGQRHHNRSWQCTPTVILTLCHRSAAEGGGEKTNKDEVIVFLRKSFLNYRNMKQKKRKWRWERGTVLLWREERQKEENKERKWVQTVHPSCSSCLTNNTSQPNHRPTAISKTALLHRCCQDFQENSSWFINILLVINMIRHKPVIGALPLCVVENNNIWLCFIIKNQMSSKPN